MTGKPQVPLAFILMPLLLFAGCAKSIYANKSFLDYAEGSRQAARDLARGKLVWLSNQPVPDANISILTKEWKPSFAKADFFGHLKSKFGIEYRCYKNASYEFLDGYNSVMREATREKFGEDYFERARNEAFPGVTEFYRQVR